MMGFVMVVMWGLRAKGCSCGARAKGGSAEKRVAASLLMQLGQVAGRCQSGLNSDRLPSEFDVDRG